MIQALRERFLPDGVVIFKPSDAPSPEIEKLAPFTSSPAAVSGKATAYVCRNFGCRLPTTDVKTMLAELGVR